MIDQRKIILKLIPWLFVLLGCMIVYSGFITNKDQVERNRQTGLVNQTYTRATNCFTAVTPAHLTPEYVESCYRKAEAATGMVVEHYGNVQ